MVYPQSAAPHEPRRLDPLDAALAVLDQSLRTLSGAVQSARPTPRPAPAALDVAESAPKSVLTESERRLSAALMRVNHVGEVCAQALYQAQSITARTPALRAQMAQAAREEVDHLAWTQERLTQLNDRPSVLNPLWYAGSFVIGLAAGRVSDAISLGFVVETERQVEAHLAGHLDRLPPNDQASRAIVAQMQADEAAHANAARESGGVDLPAPVRGLMRCAAGIMTRTAHYL